MILLRSAHCTFSSLTRHSTRSLTFTSRRWNIPPNNDPKPPSKDISSQLRAYSEQNLNALRTQTSTLVTRITSELSNLGAFFNHVTGYDEVEGLKSNVAQQENKITQARTDAKNAKTAYSTAVIARSSSQRQLNDLLQRKQSWTEDDVLQFTSLVRSDHASTIAETTAKQAMDEAEERVEKEFDSLMRVILARYHEEQVWSDKIRRAGTYGSLGAMGLNLVVFIAAILFVEPWKRKRLAETFERKVDVLQEEVKAALVSISSQVASMPQSTPPMPVPIPPTTPEIQPVETSHWWRPGPWWMWCLAAIWHPSGSPLSIAGVGIATSLAWDTWFGQPSPPEVDSSIAAAGIGCTLLYLLFSR